MNINPIIISGNLVANPTLRETNSGTPVASATIANNEFFNDGDGRRQQVTTFVDVTVWGKSGENFAALAKKGQEIIIEAQLRRNDWESEDGQKHCKHYLNAESWQFTPEDKARKQCQQITRRTPESKFRHSGAGVQGLLSVPATSLGTIHSLSLLYD